MTYCQISMYCPDKARGRVKTPWSAGGMLVQWASMGREPTVRAWREVAGTEKVKDRRRRLPERAGLGVGAEAR